MYINSIQYSHKTHNKLCTHYIIYLHTCAIYAHTVIHIVLCVCEIVHILHIIYPSA